MRATWRQVEPNRIERAENLIWATGRMLILVSLAVVGLLLFGWDQALIVLFLLAAWMAVAFSPFYPRSRTKRLTTIRDDPAPLTQHEVEVRLYREGALYGRDTGVVSFVDDWLVYNGIGTDFNIPSNLTEPLNRARFLCRACEPRDGYSWVVRLRTEPEIWISLTSRQRPFHFRHDLEAWNQNRTAVEGEPMLPPLTPQPYAKEKAREEIFNVLSLLVFGILAVVGQGIELGSGWIGPLLAVVCLGLLLRYRWYPALCWQRTLDRLERETDRSLATAGKRGDDRHDLVG